jgi:hypothetical protein
MIGIKQFRFTTTLTHVAQPGHQSGRVRLRWAFLAGFMVVTPGYSDSQEMTLCEPNETVVFSCISSREGTDPIHSTAASRTMISLCATPGLTADIGSLIYRLGADMGHTELKYPKQPLAPAKAYSAAFTSAAKGERSELYFTIGEFSYTLYNEAEVYEQNPRSNGGGVQVARWGSWFRTAGVMVRSIRRPLRTGFGKLCRS